MLNLKYPLLFFTIISITNFKIDAKSIHENESSMENSTDKVMEVNSRILEGELSLERDYRYQVAIMRLVKDYPVLTCGGAIIHRRYVLTAAHCVNNYRSHELIVKHGGVCGPYCNVSGEEKEGKSFHRVVKTFIPRVYSSLPCRKHHNDIAILKVAQIFDLSDVNHYAKVNLPEFDSDYEGYSATVTGYGPDYAPLKEDQDQMRYLQYVKQLRAMPATVISNEECQYAASVVLTEGSICAKALNPESQTCFEDDGGPLVYDGTIIGILNDRKCSFEEPELFTRVSAYLHFIKTVLEHQVSYDVLVL